MLKNPELLEEKLLEYLKSQMIQLGTNGAVVHFDGSLMSLVNIKLVQKLEEPFGFQTVITSFADNRQYVRYLHAAIQELQIPIPTIRDLSNDYEVLNSYDVAKEDIDLEIAFKKRFTDLMLNVEADRANYSVLGNMCYSQWVLNFPHRSYKNLSHIYLLNRLYYSEVIELARYLGIDEKFIERKASHYLYRSHLDEDVLGFTYEEQEKFLREGKITGLTDQKIQSKIVKEDRVKYMGPPIQRPSNLLG